MNNFIFITPEDYFKIDKHLSLAELRRRARSKGGCEVCGQPVWKLAGTGLCFTCTTGEADASNDYELFQK